MDCLVNIRRLALYMYVLMTLRCTCTQLVHQSEVYLLDNACGPMTVNVRFRSALNCTWVCMHMSNDEWIMFVISSYMSQVFKLSGWLTTFCLQYNEHILQLNIRDIYWTYISIALITKFVDLPLHNIARIGEQGIVCIVERFDKVLYQYHINQ